MNNDSLFMAVILSILVLVGFQYFYEQPRRAEVHQQQLVQKVEKENKPLLAPEVVVPRKERTAVVAETKRVQIHTPELKGSINLTGGRIDDLALVNYTVSVDEKADPVTILSPAGSSAPNLPYYAETGWLADNISLPTTMTEWKASSSELTPEKPVTLTWDNGAGLVFERVISIDDHFMFSIADRVINKGAATVTLYPFGLIARHGLPKTSDTYVSYEGPMGVFNGTLMEPKYKELTESGKRMAESDGGWLGFTDKYWLLALIPDQNEKIEATFSHEKGDIGADAKMDVFQSDFRGTPMSLAAGASAEKTVRLFAGAKRVRLLDKYADQYNIPLFDRAIDFGWYYFLTKPFLYLLDILGGVFGNLGLAIIALTIALRALVFPLSAKSYRSMARLRELQPEMKKLQERFKDNKMALSEETMALYRREKVNPMSGCLPSLVQIPIFFALYKVLFIGIEMRHAPFYGWIHDLSSPDPTSVLTFFGAINWSFIPHVGVWPLLMGISMFIQQKLSPQPADKTQATMFMFLPILFTFMLANMASGLVIYWTFSNILGLIQQWTIMRKYAPVKG